ncbi:unnamed protein product [Didymodactylos carnosus]|uniref:Uncharacterized protein n=1 Tax=Didymodactylos carnosus TaxID=1234261 RepID=A0A814SK45_9BILA|nr:unnamed protein product [Didymodactylos carnosus]CAF1309782.1 unnamed protein product [Didymodactylos carnosus]CAF3912064.1 unnamed protein product [Didymodactylos carnosus]CAF4117507.1 unnamed protein product [Didymodactylos carnosus]
MSSNASNNSNLSSVNEQAKTATTSTAANYAKWNKIEQLSDDDEDKMIKGIEGHWTLVKFEPYPGCEGYEFDIIKNTGGGDHVYHICTIGIINKIWCTVEQTGAEEWKVRGKVNITDDAHGLEEGMKRDRIIAGILQNIQNIEQKSKGHLVLTTANIKIVLERLPATQRDMEMKKKKVDT